MTRRSLRIISLSLACLAVLAMHVRAADPVSRTFPDDSAARGVVVLAGLNDAQRAVALVKMAPVVVLAVAPDAKGAEALRDAFHAAGVLGQATAIRLGADGRVTLADDTAATLIADLDALPALAPEEMRRVVRPYGTIHSRKDGAWTKEILERPAGMDDWGHYHKDAKSSEHSRDTLVGPARGLQWIAGPTNGQDYNLVMREMMFGLFPLQVTHREEERLIARDAFSGLPLWIRPDFLPRNRFCIVADEDSVYVHPATHGRVGPHTLMLDRASGETVLEYREGFDFTVPEEQARNWRAFSEQHARAEDLQLRVVEGHLVQVLREGIVVLDAKTGKRKWNRKAEKSYGFVHPVAGDGRLYVVEGEFVRHSSYTHWPMAAPDRIHALDLATGRSVWTFTWDKAQYGDARAVYNLQLEGQRLAGAVTVTTSHKPQAHGLILNAENGEVIYWGRENDAWPGNTGAGHSHVRLHLRGDRAWTFEIGHPIAHWDVNQPGEFQLFKDVFKGRLRPVSCTVWRSTPNWWFGGIGSCPASGEGRGFFNNSGRSNCDIGAFPANGLVYSPPNLCQCQPYLPGNKVYHSRQPLPPVSLASRLVKGIAQPAPMKDGTGEGWPQWQRDPARRAWASEAYPTQPEQLWQYTATAAKSPGLLDKQWERDATIRGGVTQATCAEGVLVFGRPHRHEVVALDPATGVERWRAVLDGRIDMAPTIHQGLVLCGTRNGYVYALNRDTGQQVWRFLAAPIEDRILVNGQLESPWPVFGAIPVDDDGLVALAGRHSDNDGGLWWWQLEPATGKVLGHGRIGQDEPPDVAANQSHRRPADMPSAQNSVTVMTDRWFIMPGANVRRTSGRLGSAKDGERLGADDYADPDEIAAVQLAQQFMRLGRNAPIGEPKATVGGWRKPYYAHTLARIFAIRGDEFVSVGGGLDTAGGRGGGGGSFVHKLRLLEKPVIGRPFGKRLAEPVWAHEDRLLHSRGLPSVSAMAVSADAVYLGASIYGRDAAWQKAQAEMAHRLRILDLKDGTLIRDVAVSGRVLQGGIALADDRIYVATEDGSVTAFAAP